MRLLKTNVDRTKWTLELEEHLGDAVPAYAILSHTWGKEEVLFQDIQNRMYLQKKGFEKVKCAIQQARIDGLAYLWIDSCCINKESSAELSEAINSMFAWYAGASICYSYLIDVTASPESAEFLEQFGRSRWWTRGWTLQELLAPAQLEFFSSAWVPLGNKVDLQHAISGITQIDSTFLTGATSLTSASIAKRMSWVGYRATTRPEDLVYCLMGMFDVHMPLIYGEGRKAILRLQEEITRRSDDQSLFAWRIENGHKCSRSCYHGMLADSPEAFARSGSIYPFSDWRRRKPFGTTNMGLSVELHLYPTDEEGLYLAAINCGPLDGLNGYLAILLKRIQGTEDQYGRVECHRLGKTEMLADARMVYVPQSFNPQRNFAIYSHHYFSLRRLIDTTTSRPQYLMTNSLSNPVTLRRSNAIPAAEPEVHSWISRVLPVTGFEITKKANNLAAVAILSSAVVPRTIAIMLGSSSSSDFEVGFDVAWSEHSILGKVPGFKDYERIFAPQPMGVKMQVANFQVVVEVEETIDSATKTYLVDITIEHAKSYLSGHLDQVYSSSNGVSISKGRLMGS